MRILFVAAEVAPFVSVGGLSQVMYFLPRALSKLGHDVRIFTPKYGRMDANYPKGKPWSLAMEFEGLQVPIDSDDQTLTCNVKSYKNGQQKPQTYFLENREYYELRANVFGYKDDHVRFALLSKGALEWLLRKDTSWWPDIIHCNDWHTSYLIEFARRDKRYRSSFSKTPIVLTVHNFAHQGNYDFRYAFRGDRDEGSSKQAGLLSPKLQRQNALLRGILYADAVNTVSPTHAVEILTPEYAEGLETVLQKVSRKLTGILNGIDTDEFNPATDRLIKKTFTKRTVAVAKRINKEELQKRFGLPADPSRPLFAVAGRLSQQKGWDLLLEVLPHLFRNRLDVQIVVLGSGEDRYRERLSLLAKLHQPQLGVALQSDFELSHMLFAGADMFLIPSFFEPGGIVALEALRYGAIPIVRRTGGLNDIIEDFNPKTGLGNGFSFIHKDPWALYGVVIEALTLYNQPIVWEKLVDNALTADFSWDHAAKEYERWYKEVV